MEYRILFIEVICKCFLNDELIIYCTCFYLFIFINDDTILTKGDL